MPDEHKEVISLEFRAVNPTEAQLGGIHVVSKLLDKIEAQMGRINSIAISPVGIKAGAITSETKAIEGQAAAILRLAAARSQLQKTTTTTTKIPNQADVVKTEQLFKLGPGATRSVTTTDGSPGSIIKDTMNNAQALREAHALVNKQYEQVYSEKEEADAALAKKNVDVAKAGGAKMAQAEADAARAKSAASSSAASKAQADVAQKKKDQIDFDRRQYQIRLAQEKNRIAAAERAEKEIADFEAAKANEEAANHAKLTKFFDQRARMLTDIQQHRDAITRLQEAGFEAHGTLRTRRTAGGGITEIQELSKIIDGRRHVATFNTTRNSGGQFESGFMSEKSVGLGERINRNMLTNIGHVGAWMAGVQVLYGTIRLVTGAMHTLTEVGMQTARLSQVYRGVGGSVEQLTNDIFQLAVAERRSRDEAIESAIQWSRLGLTRSQINEAVRVSLQAANVAEMTAGDATERLSGIMQGYHLHVGELAGKLGEINAISNTWNITNQDLINGLARVAPIARAAGLSFEETIGIISAGKGTTGMTGPNFGNALKSVIGSMSDPSIQKMLRDKFKIEVTTSGGSEVKDMSTVLQQLFVSYQNLTESERRFMVYQIAGKQQAARLAAMLDSYVQSQILAINSQMNLNSAEQESIKIRATLVAQMTALKTEWERFITVQGQGLPSDGLAVLAETMRHLLQLANTRVGSGLISSFAVMMGAVAVKVALTASTMEKIPTAMSFVQNSIEGVKNGFRFVNEAMALSVQNFMATGSSTKGLSGIMRGFITVLEPIAAKFDAAALSGGRFANMAKVASFAVRGMQTSMVMLAEFAGPLLLITAGITVFNGLMESFSASSRNAARQTAMFSDKAEQAGAAARAAATAVKLFGTAIDVVGNGNTTLDRKKEIIGQVSSVAYYDKNGNADTARDEALKAELLTMVEQGHEVQAIARMEEVKREIHIRGLTARKDELDMLNQQNAVIRTQVAMLENKQKRKPLEKSEQDELNSYKDQQRANQEKITGTILKHSQDADEDFKQKLEADVKHLAFLEKEKMLAESIKQIYDGMAGTTHADRLDAQVQAKEKELEHLNAMVQVLENDPSVKKDMEAEGAKERTEKLQEYMRLREEASSNNDKLESLPGGMDEANAIDTRLQLARAHLQNYVDNPFNKKDFSTQAFTLGSGAAVQKLFEHQNEGFLNEKSGNFSGKQVMEMMEKRRALTAELGRLAKELQKADSTPDVKVESQQRNQAQITDLNKRKKQIEAEIAAMNSPITKSIANQQDVNDAVARGLKLNMEAAAVGENQADKLVTQMKYLDAIIQQKQAIHDLDGKTLTIQEQAYLKVQALNEQEKLRHERNELIAKLQAEQVNVAKELGREYQRSLLLASPSDLLRKLAVKSLVDRNGGTLNLGGFLSLDEKARKDAQDYSPNLNHRSQEIANQLRKLGARDSINKDVTDTTRENDLRHHYRQFAGPNLNGATDSINVTARTNAQIGELGIAASNAAAKINDMAARAAAFIATISAGHPGAAATVYHPAHDDSVLAGQTSN